MSLLNIIKYLWTSLYKLCLLVHYIPACVLLIGYEPADLNVHLPSSQKNCRRWVHFFRIVSSVLKNVLEEKSVFFGDIQVKETRN